MNSINPVLEAVGFYVTVCFILYGVSLLMKTLIVTTWNFFENDGGEVGDGDFGNTLIRAYVDAYLINIAKALFKYKVAAGVSLAAYLVLFFHFDLKYGSLGLAVLLFIGLKYWHSQLFELKDSVPDYSSSFTKRID